MGAGVKRVVPGIATVFVWAVMGGVPPASAQAQSPWWRLSTGSRPTELALDRAPEDVVVFGRLDRVLELALAVDDHAGDGAAVGQLRFFLQE